jgi:hypothetical protein
VIVKLSPDGSSLLYATYLGGHGEDYPTAIQVDAEGNAIVGGWVAAPDFPTTPGAYSLTLNGSSDAFVTILDPSGTSLIASTFFGGSAPEQIKYDSCEDLALDALGRVVIGGATRSPDLPVTLNAFQPSIPLPVDSGGFIARLSADLSAVDYCSYVGCTEVRGVAVDASLCLFAAGEVETNASQGVPVTPGAFQTTFGGSRDAFVLKTNTDGSLAWCTLLGGNNADRPQALELDAEADEIEHSLARRACWHVFLALGVPGIVPHLAL